MELEKWDNYRDFPHDLTVLTMYHVHVPMRMSDGVVRFNNFYFACFIPIFVRLILILFF